jgi:hypothetical protein
MLRSWTTEFCLAQIPRWVRATIQGSEDARTALVDLHNPV